MNYLFNTVKEEDETPKTLECLLTKKSDEQIITERFSMNIPEKFKLWMIKATIQCINTFLFYHNLDKVNRVSSKSMEYYNINDLIMTTGTREKFNIVGAIAWIYSKSSDIILCNFVKSERHKIKRIDFNVEKNSGSYLFSVIIHGYNEFTYVCSSHDLTTTS